MCVCLFSSRRLPNLEDHPMENLVKSHQHGILDSEAYAVGKVKEEFFPLICRSSFSNLSSGFRGIPRSPVRKRRLASSIFSWTVIERVRGQKAQELDTLNLSRYLLQKNTYDYGYYKNCLFIVAYLCEFTTVFRYWNLPGHISMLQDMKSN